MRNMETLVEKIVRLEWEAFDKVQNEGGRASCQVKWMENTAHLYGYADLKCAENSN